MRRWLWGLAAAWLCGAVLGCGEPPVSNQPEPKVNTKVIKHKDGASELRSSVEETKD
jgi:hypothetical protein